MILMVVIEKLGREFITMNVYNYERMNPSPVPFYGLNSMTFIWKKNQFYSQDLLMQ